MLTKDTNKYRHNINNQIGSNMVSVPFYIKEQYVFEVDAWRFIFMISRFLKKNLLFNREELQLPRHS